MNIRRTLNRIIRWAVKSGDGGVERTHASEPDILASKNEINVQIIRAVNGHIVTVRTGGHSPYVDMINYPETYVGMDDDVMKTVATAIVAARLEK